MKNNIEERVRALEITVECIRTLIVVVLLVTSAINLGLI